MVTHYLTGVLSLKGHFTCICFIIIIIYIEIHVNKTMLYVKFGVMICVVFITFGLFHQRM